MAENKDFDQENTYKSNKKDFGHSSMHYGKHTSEYSDEESKKVITAGDLESMKSKKSKASHKTDKTHNASKTHNEHKISSHDSSEHKSAVRPHTRSGRKKDNTTRNSLIAVGVLIVIVVVILLLRKGASLDTTPTGIVTNILNEDNSVDDSEIVAKIGNSAILMEEFEAEYDKLPEQYKSFVPKDMFLKTVLVPQKLLGMKAEEITDEDVEKEYLIFLDSNDLTDKELEDRLAEQDIDIDKFKEALRIQIYINNTLGDKIEITDEEIEEFYEESKEELVDENNETISFEDMRKDIQAYLYNQKYVFETQNLVKELEEEIGVEILYEGTDDGVQSPLGTGYSVASVDGETFTDTGDEICMEDGKPLVILFTTTWCPHCTWIKDTFDSTVLAYGDEIAAYHFELDTKDDSLTEEVEGEVSKEYRDIYQKYNPDGSIPTFVFGCKYFRIGNGYEGNDDLDAEKAEFEKIIEELIA